jgi:hypothetical protein
VSKAFAPKRNCKELKSFVWLLPKRSSIVSIILSLLFSVYCHADENTRANNPAMSAEVQLDKAWIAAVESDMTKGVARAKKKPPDLTDDDIAKYLARGMRIVRTDDVQRIAMWAGPMRVSIEDEHGEDLDLSTYPGDAIKYYLTSLADFAKLPLTITKAESHDNNFSIVVSNEGIEGSVGAIYGVPELAAHTSEKLSGLIQPRQEGRVINLGDGFYSNAFVENYVVKACAIYVGNSREKMKFPQLKWPGWFEMNGAIERCLRPSGYTPRPNFSNASHYINEYRNTFYLLELFYNSGIEPNMDSDIAERKITEYLNSKQKPN